MNNSHTIERKVTQYFDLENCFVQIEESLKGIIPENGYKVSIEPHDEKTKFWLSCSSRKILVNFSSFGESGSKFLGKITFEINDDKNENKTIASIYFDEHGNNYYKQGAPANSWSINQDNGREPLLLHVLGKYIEFMQTEMNS